MCHISFFHNQEGIKELYVSFFQEFSPPLTVSSTISSASTIWENLMDGAVPEPRYRSMLMIPFTWLSLRPDILDPVMHQGSSLICWAIALVRHLAASLRLKGKLEPNEELSIQHLVDYTPLAVMNAKCGYMLEDLNGVGHGLTTKGIVTQSIRPLVFPIIREQGSRYYPVDHPVYRFRKMKIISRDAFDLDPFLCRLIEKVKISPVAARIRLKVSYMTFGTGIYNPVAGEASLPDGPDGHMVLLTGCWIDEVTNLAVFQAQDSYGTEWGVDGYIRISMPADIITDFYVFESCDKGSARG